MSVAISNELDDFVLAYLNDEEIDGYNGVNGALLEACRRDDLAAQQLALDALEVKGILTYVLPSCPDYSQLDCVDTYGEYI